MMKKYKLKKYLGIIIALIISTIFLVSGISKIIYFGDFFLLLTKYEIFPNKIIPVLELLLIGTEITIGICLLIPLLRDKAAMFAICLFGFFIIFIIYIHMKGIITDCGCFPFLKERKIGLDLAFQDGILLLMSVFLYRFEKQKPLASKG